MVRGDTWFALWSPALNEVRTVVDVDLQLATSPDGQSLGIVLADGRVGLAAYATFRGAIRSTTGEPASGANCPLGL